MLSFDSVFNMGIPEGGGGHLLSPEFVIFNVGVAINVDIKETKLQKDQKQCNFEKNLSYSKSNMSTLKYWGKGHNFFKACFLMVPKKINNKKANL